MSTNLSSEAHEGDKMSTLYHHYGRNTRYVDKFGGIEKNGVLKSSQRPCLSNLANEMNMSSVYQAGSPDTGASLVILRKTLSVVSKEGETAVHLLSDI